LITDHLSFYCFLKILPTSRIKKFSEHSVERNEAEKFKNLNPFLFEEY